MPTTTSSDAPAVRKVLAEAFVTDPLMQWIFPDADHRLEATAAWLGLFAERYVRTGRTDVIEADDASQTDGLAEVALWRMPDDAASAPPSYAAPPPPALPSLPSISGLLAALIGRTRAEAIGQSFGAIATVTPQGPHAYLHFLAVRPPWQRQGLGRRVLGPGIAFADSSGLGVHLETTNPENLGFYRSLGFKVTNQVRLEPDGPELWALWRDPSPAPNSQRSGTS